MNRRRGPRDGSLTSLLDVLFILLFASLLHASVLVEAESGEDLEHTLSTPSESEPNTDAEAADAMLNEGHPEPVDLAQPSTEALLDQPPADLNGEAGARDEHNERHSATSDSTQGKDEADLFESREDFRVRAAQALLEATMAREWVTVEVDVAGHLVRVQIEGQPPIEVNEALLEEDDDPLVRRRYRAHRDPDLRLCTQVRKILGAADLADSFVVVDVGAPLERLTLALADGLAADQARCLVDERALAVVVYSAPLP